MLSIGIIGLPNAGKSTLFNALTENNVLAANYPFATIEPNTGIVPVPDARLSVLAKMFTSVKVIPATVTFVDIAGLVAGASTGEGLGNKFLANIRECDAIVHVVRAFTDDNVQHVSADINPQRDIDIINTELILADIQTLENHLPKVLKEAKADPKARSQANYLQYILDELKAGKRAVDLLDFDTDKLANLQLLTAKRTIYLFNIDEVTIKNDAKKKTLAELAAPAKSVFVCAKLEEELRGLKPAEQRELLADYGATESGLDQLARAAYDTLHLQSFLTAGPKETRAWTIPRGATAPEAAGVIHTDFQKGFIAAQVVSYQDLIDAGSEAEAKKLGKVRTEGKTYIMQPDDVVEFRFNV